MLTLRTERRSLVGSISLNMSRNSLTEKVLLYSKFIFENQMWLIKRYARKSIYHRCMVWIEKSVTRDHCSASLSKPRDADQWPSWQIFLSTTYTHERYLFSHSYRWSPEKGNKRSNYDSGEVYHGRDMFDERYKETNEVSMQGHQLPEWHMYTRGQI